MKNQEIDHYLLGIFSWFGYVLPFQERIRLIKEAGFASTSIWWEDEDTPWPMKKESMPQLVRDMGIFVENIHVPFNESGALWSEQKSVRTNIIKSHLNWLNACADHQIPIMVMHLTEQGNHPAPNRSGLESMLELVKVAEGLGVKIAIENTLRSDNVPYILERIDSKYLGFCYDSSHYNLTDKLDFHLLDRYGGRLMSTHLSDNDGLKDRHWLPGQGIIDWTKVANHFPTSYRGCLTLEAYATKEEREDSPQNFLEKAYQRAVKIRDIITEEAK
ncbi:sugar phosphate isomerase/epimerase family protein [Desulfosporosinus sp.]|uniref:sugar phosphate isomerase/epimerase family protein n=1 Tax=Desulfosporosinus sp. TaxID=157907 RepID=UPI00231C758A|nr:sugar phosphate isomerase/epimerase family protein [Desulfosporosinus sp.]MCO5388225.1 sugar phosphate isomerase/epimerase [Desulfosporosinus sp.]MDA8224233.1 sugar phosphate isomerase/epimerase [Desulfitobacterium hafniense]